MRLPLCLLVAINLAMFTGCGGGSGRAAKHRAGGDSQSYNVAHAFVYADGIMYDLDKVLPADSGWELNQASAINNKGQIVGLGTYQAQMHAFMLSPQWRFAANRRAKEAIAYLQQ